jgi:5'-nucleotidase (lipoprotein e(P4) family)
MSKIPLLLALGAALLAGCASSPAPRATHAPTAAPSPVANDNLNAVAWMQTAIEHDLIFREVYRDAGEKLLRALTDPDWDALPHDERKNAVRGLKPAVILDIDETVLDNSPYQARLVAHGGEYNEATWAAWCREQAARPLPGALAYTRLAAARGVTVFYLSNRAQDLNDATLANLRADGFPLGVGEEVFLGLGKVFPGCEQIGTEKTCRREWIGAHYRVLAQIGDQIGDFVSVAANTRDGRASEVAAYQGWVGERWFVLPNPAYGSWEPALFGNDWEQPAARRRQRKIDALRQ